MCRYVVLEETIFFVESVGNTLMFRPIEEMNTHEIAYSIIMSDIRMPTKRSIAFMSDEELKSYLTSLPISDQMKRQITLKEMISQYVSLLNLPLLSLCEHILTEIL
jgi:hypothetical protein